MFLSALTYRPGNAVGTTWLKCRFPRRELQSLYYFLPAMDQNRYEGESIAYRARRLLQRLRRTIISIFHQLRIFNSCRLWLDEQQETITRQREVPHAKLLLLGASDTGKSTFMKQMRYVFGDTYPTEDRRRHLPHIRRNLLESLHKMVRAMDRFGIAQATEEAQEAAQRFMDLEPLEVFIQEEAAVDSVLVHQTQVLWADPGVREVFRRGNEYHLLTNAEYFITNSEKILGEDYLPTMDDIFRMRYPTQGAMSTHYDLGELRMTIHDMGGQRCERQNWVNQVNDPTAILFLASLSEYDQTVEEAAEDPSKNRVQESLDIFKELLGFPLFANTPVILLLNKSDVFREKILYHSLSDYFPTYDGPDEELSGREFISGLYEELVVCHNRHYVARFTEATNTDNFKAIFCYIRNHVNRSFISKGGLC